MEEKKYVIALGGVGAIAKREKITCVNGNGTLLVTQGKTAAARRVLPPICALQLQTHVSYSLGRVRL